MSTTDTPTARLTRAAIVEAADGIVRGDGIGALSMRRVADWIGVSTMASYRHIRGRAHLGALLVDDLLRDVAGAGEDDPAGVPLDDLVVGAAFGLCHHEGLEAELTSETIERFPDLEHLARWYRQVVDASVDPHAAGLALALTRALARDGLAVDHVRRAARGLVATTPVPARSAA